LYLEKYELLRVHKWQCKKPPVHVVFLRVMEHAE
jgi:hypothetical protein